jgi:hypothetical protein
MALPVTIGDRFRAAWKAFKQNTKPDPDAFRKFLARQAEEMRLAIEKLDPYDRALVTSIAGGTENAEQLLDQVMPAIERLDEADQIKVVKHICKGNPHATLYPAMQGWSKRHCKAMAATLSEREKFVLVERV